jgi:RNA polymerase sigma factor (sigma-70 family)
MTDTPNKSICKTSYTLLDRVRDPNDEVAWKEFIAYYEQYIYNILRHIGLSEIDAKETQQEIIVKLWKKMPEFVYDKDRGKFRQWLGVVIRNEANQYFRKTTRLRKVVDSVEDDELEKYLDPNNNEGLDTIIVNEWNQYISNLAWDNIKVHFRENAQKVFLLHADGKTSEEISKICDIKQNSVNVHIKRVRDHLKEQIKKLNEELL